MELPYSMKKIRHTAMIKKCLFLQQVGIREHNGTEHTAYIVHTDRSKIIQTSYSLLEIFSIKA